jgi:hypothetical protein
MNQNKKKKDLQEQMEISYPLSQQNCVAGASAALKASCAEQMAVKSRIVQRNFEHASVHRFSFPKNGIGIPSNFCNRIPTDEKY